MARCTCGRDTPDAPGKGAALRTVIVGAGAVGGTVGAYLTRAGRDVTLVDSWWQHIDAIRRNGLEVWTPDGTFHTRPAALHVDGLAALGAPVDLAVIATKAYDGEWAYRLIEPYLAPDGVVMFAQNGVVEELVSRFADQSRVLGVVVNFAAECFEPGVVRRTLTSGWPSLTIGELDGGSTPRVAAIRHHLDPVGDVRSTATIFSSLWSKLALNAMTNATGAVTRATTPVLWGEPDYAEVALQAGAEAVVVARAAGLNVEPVFDRIDPTALARVYDGDPAASTELVRVLRVIADGRRGTRENRPSMLQDILKGRRTEVDYIPGHIVRRGSEQGVPTPINARLAELVREVEAGRLPGGPDNLALIRSALPQ
jgi:2-dehydropantoate 2-reductase